MAPEQLATPTTPLEVAELVRAATMPDHQLSQEGVDVLRRLIFDWERLKEAVGKLQAFKSWVHNYLDQHGVPHHPLGSHGAAGCRIGDRMDWLMAKQARLEEVRGILLTALKTAAEAPRRDWLATKLMLEATIARVGGS